VALAGDHAHRESESWRGIASHVYAYALAAVSIALFYLFPPHFDFHLGVVVPVAIVAVFLVFMERPVKTPATTVAPLTAILSASGVVFGAWIIVLAVVAWVTVRLRIVTSEGGKWLDMITPILLGQTATAIISSYAVLGTWSLISRAISVTPHAFVNLVALFGIVGVGLAWQTANNLTAYFYYLLNGRPFIITQLLRTGIVASIYAYLLVATYKFGGLLATTIFYVVVAQIKVAQDVLGITTQLHKLDKANDQARGLVRDLVRLTDTETVEFASEVQNISQMMGRHLGMSKRDIDLLGLAAELHEIGKSRIPARIRSGIALNPKELAQKKTYTRWGGLMIRAADALLPGQIADWIEFHGEHFDGTGYPRGLKGEDIPLPSRIIAVARDYVRFLTGYDGAESVDKEKALTLLRASSGTLYDPRLVSLLHELVS
jgi:HD-GYP domain-containing protein (c-di-GMP phosphodiesterase class II)